MPVIRKLTPTELQAIQNKGKSRRILTAELYDTLIANFDIGDYGEVELAAEEKRPTVRKHLKAAAQRYGVALRFKRSSNDRLLFHIDAPEAEFEQGTEDRTGAAQDGIDSVWSIQEGGIVLSYTSRSVDALEDLEDIPF